MTDTDRKKAEQSDAPLAEKQEKAKLTDEEMSKISGGLNVDVGAFGVPEYSNGSA